MSVRRMDRFLYVLTGVLLLFQTQCLLVPDDTESGRQVPNQRPEVRITAGAASPDSAGVDYRVLFQWVGSDKDGVVTTFQFAMDDTVSEHAWQDTTGFAALMRFQASTPREENEGEFTDWHTFYIRAIDNEFAVSEADKRYFNARTVAPNSWITFPEMSKNPTSTFQKTIVMRWEGSDLDSSRPDKKPIFFEYKLVRISSSSAEPSEVRNALLHGDNVLLDTLKIGSKARWVRVPTTVKERTLEELPGETSFAFAVRAVDEAGAIEPALDQNRNYIAFSVSSQTSQPVVTVTEESLGGVAFPRSPVLIDGTVWQVDVPAGRPLRFNWFGFAGHYGSEPGNSNYALDIPDPEDETLRDPRGIGGWIGWGQWKGNQSPFLFGDSEDGSIHTLYIYMRDVSDAESSTRKCIIRMRVVSFTASRFALVVDDARWQAGGPSDTAHDRFISSTISRRMSDFGDVDHASIYTDVLEGGQGGSITPVPIPLRTIAQYRYIIWSYNRSSGESGLAFTEATDKRLSNFVGAGGRLFLFGGGFAAAERRSFRYPIAPPDPDEDIENRPFYFKFLYMRNTVNSAAVQDRCQRSKNGMVAARSLNPAYPDIELDPDRWNPWRLENGQYKGGIEFWEGIQRQSNETIEQLPGLDSLYAVQTWNRSIDEQCGEELSPLDGSICGMRYESTHADTLLGRQHGRVISFNFQPYYFQPERVADASTAAINWLVTGRDF